MQKSNISVDEVHRFVKGFRCSMFMSSVFRCFCVPTFHVLLYRCYGFPSFVFTYSGILVLSAPVHITFSSLSYNVEGVFNSVVAGKFVRYFRPSWRSTRFVARKSKSLFLLLPRNHFCVGAACFQKGFLFNNWAISRALIGGCSIRLQTMEITWWWHNWFFSFSRARFSVKSERKWTSKLSIESFSFEDDNKYEI